MPLWYIFLLMEISHIVLVKLFDVGGTSSISRSQLFSLSSCVLLTANTISAPGSLCSILVPVVFSANALAQEYNSAIASDAGLQRLLAMSGGFASSVLYANTANVGSCGTMAGSSITLPYRFSSTSPYPAGTWGGVWTSNAALPLGIAGANPPPCAVLLSNGCILSQQTQPASGAPYFCVPAGLGSRFLSVLITQEALGGVTDTGNLVFFGATPNSLTPSTSNWQKCVFFAGPFTPMAIVLLLRQTPYALRYSINRAISLCALTRSGSLECSDIVPSWWAASNGPWSNWATFNVTGVTTPNQSACQNGDSTPGKFLRPSSVLCPNSAPLKCVAPSGLSSFSMSSCIGSGTYITGIRLGDNMPVAWLVGFDSFDAAPPVNSSAGQNGIFGPLTALTASPYFPPVVECMVPFGARTFVGRLQDGSFFRVRELVEQQGAVPVIVANLNSSAANFVIADTLTAGMDWGAGINAVLIGPVFPFSYSSTSVNSCNSGCPGYQGSDALQGSYWGQNAVGIRPDGSIAIGIGTINYPQIPLLSSSPQIFASLLMHPSMDMICATKMAASAYRTSSTGYYSLNCAGSLFDNGIALTLNSGMCSICSAAGNFFSHPLQSLPPDTFQFASFSRTGIIAVGFRFPSATIGASFGSLPCYVAGSTCIAWYGGPPSATLTVGGNSAIFGVSKFVLEPVAASFWCATFVAASSSSCLFQCTGAVPGHIEDRPLCSSTILAFVVTSSTVCAIQASDGFLWCFSDDISNVTYAAAARGLPTITPAGASPLRAIIIQKNTTAISSSENIVCGLFETLQPNIACFGPPTDPVVTFAGGFSSLGDFAVTRGGSQASPVGAFSVSIANSHACVIDKAFRLFCWGNASSSVAINAVNTLQTSTFFSVACGGKSVCAVSSTSQLACYGGTLDPYVVNGQLPALIGNTTFTVSSGADQLSSTLSSGILVVVSASGNDVSCSAVPANSAFDIAFAASCSSASRAIVVGSLALPGSAALTVCIHGSVSSVAALTLPSSGLFSLVGCMSMFSSSAAQSQGDRLTFTGNCNPACITAPYSPTASLILSGLSLMPTSSQQMNCTRVLYIGTQLASVSNINFTGWTCSDSLIHFDYNKGLALLRNLDSPSNGSYTTNVLPAAAVEIEAVGIIISSSSAPLGISSSYVTGQHVGGVTAINCSLASLIFLDQGIYAKVDNLALINVSASYMPMPPRWAAYSSCGVGLRLNNIAIADVTGIAASAISGKSGGAVCITDMVFSGVTLANNPFPTRLQVKSISVTGCMLSADACGVCVFLAQSVRVQLFVANVTVRSAVVESGAAVFLVGVTSPTLANIVCSLVTSSASGGCMHLEAFSSAEVSAISAFSTSAAGNGALLWALSPASSSLTLSSVFCSQCAAGGYGGALALDGAATASINDITCISTSAGSLGGCIAVNVSTLTIDGGKLTMTGINSSNCTAGVRGGALSVVVGMKPGDDYAVSLVKSSIKLSSAGSCVTASSCPVDSVPLTGGGGVSFVCSVPSASSIPADSTTISSIDGSNGFVNGVALPIVLLQTVTMIGNAAVQGASGGALLLQRAQTASCHPVATLVDTFISECIAGGSGGGIYADSSLVEAQRVTIANCSAAIDGGGWFAHGSAFFSPNLIASHNSAGRYGGGGAMGSCTLTGLRLTDATEVSDLAPSASSSPSPTPISSATSIFTATSTMNTTTTGSRSISSSANATKGITSSQSTTQTISSALSMTGSPSVTANVTTSPTNTLSTTQTPTPTRTGSQTPTQTASLSANVTSTRTRSANTTTTPSTTASHTAAFTSTQTSTRTGTIAPSSGISSSATMSGAASVSATWTAAVTASVTSAQTGTGTASVTGTGTNTASSSRTQTSTVIASGSPTGTASKSANATASNTGTQTRTASVSITHTGTLTVAATPTVTQSCPMPRRRCRRHGRPLH